MYRLEVCVWRVAQAFDLAGANKIVVPRPLRTLQRAGSWNACAMWLHSLKSCVGSIVTRPCKKRKDGAPSP